MLDDLEIWQIAAALGVHDPPADGPAKLRSGGAESAVARRMRAAQAGLPEPEPDTPDPAVMAWAAQFNVRP